LERVSKAGAKFDPDKTKWFQQQHLRHRDNATLAAELQSRIETDKSLEELTIISGLMKERATFVQDIKNEGDFLFHAPSEYDEKTLQKKWKDDAAAIMTSWMDKLSSIETFDATTIEHDFKSFLEAHELGIGKVLPLFRLLITGKGMGPSMFEIAAFLGKGECISRMKTGIKTIAQLVEG
jgi:glutamyl-tRNA synthetase